MWYSAKPINQFELAKNNEFKETLKSNIFWMEFMIDEYKEMKTTVLTLINQIDNEIKN
jgi:aconitase B